MIQEKKQLLKSVLTLKHLTTISLIRWITLKTTAGLVEVIHIMGTRNVNK